MFDLMPEESFTAVLTEFHRVLKPRGRMVLVNMAKGQHWYNHVWEKVYQIQPSWMGGCRGVSLMSSVAEMGFSELQREFISQMTFPSEIIYGVKG